MQKVSRIAVVNAGVFTLKFRIRVDDQPGNSNWSRRYVQGSFKIMDVRKDDRLKGLKKGSEIYAEIDVMPIKEGGTGVTKGERVVYDPDTDAVAIYVASRTLVNRRLTLIK